MFRHSYCTALFVEELCDERWSKAYYRKIQLMFTDFPAPLPNVSLNVSPKRPSKSLNHNQCFRDAAQICTKLSSLAAEAGGETYLTRIKILQNLCAIWEHGEEARILSNSIGNGKLFNRKATSQFD